MSEVRTRGLFGKLAPRFPVGLRDFSTYSGALPYPASTVHHEQLVKTWPMDGNDQYGDCVAAAAAHMIQSWDATTGVQLPVPTEQAVVSEYFTLTGGRDNGLVMSDTLNTWMHSGLWGNRILGYAPVKPTSQLHLKQAVNFYGAAFLGMQLPQNSMSQFDHGQPWSLVTGWQTQKIIGGHAVPALGYDANYLYVVTWGSVQKVAWDWYYVYGDEAWCVLPQNDLTAVKGMGGMNLASLKLDLPGV